MEDKYEILEKLGSGAYGKVYKVQCRQTNTIFALKVIDLSKQSDQSKLKIFREVQILQKLKHPYIVEYIESFYDSNIDTLNIVQEYCEGGDLQSRIKNQIRKRKKYFNEKHILQWMVQIASALEYIHENRIIHRDLKPANLMLTRDNTIKIGDFGVSYQFKNQKEDNVQESAGTPFYFSPEQIMKQKYTYSTDIWSLGAVLFEIMSLRHPYLITKEKKDSKDLSVFDKTPPLPNCYSLELVSLLQMMLRINQDQRIKARQILRLKFMTQVIDDILWRELCKKKYQQTLSDQEDSLNNILGQNISQSLEKSVKYEQNQIQNLISFFYDKIFKVH